MSEWKEVKLYDIMSFTNGKKRPYTDGAVPVYGGNGILAYSSTSNFTTCIIIGRVGAYCGNVFYEKNRCWVSDNAIAAKNKENNSIQYCYYLLKSLKLNERHIGTSQPLLTQEILNKITVKIPTFKMQQQIVKVLSTLDDKIELNTQINHNLEEQAKAIFKSWFVDFEPFQNGKFVDSELGKIPQGWECVSFENFLLPRNEKSSDSTLQMYAVTDHGITKRENKFHKKLSKSETKNKVFYSGDLVFGMSREILNWGIMHDAVGGVSSAYNIYEITKGIDPLFVEFYMYSNQVYFQDLIRPATREGQGIDKGALARKKLIYPPVHIWNGIKQMLSLFAEKRESTNNEIADLIELRDSLLPKLMSGEIDVSEVEI